MSALAGADLAGYRAVREAAALTAAQRWGVIVLRGPDRVRFLHNLISNDVKGLKAGHSNWSAALALKGKVLAVLRVLSLPEELWVTLPAEQKDPILAHLKKYKIVDKVEFEDRSAAGMRLSLYGAHGAQQLQAAGAALPDLAPGQHAAASLAGAQVEIDRSQDVTGAPGYDLYVAKDSAAAVRDALEAAGAASLTDAALEVLRIEAGWPVYGIDVSDDNFPGEVELERAVSYTKGCFLGQETVARIRSRGHVNRLLRGLRLQGDRLPDAGAAALADGKEIGRVTSACHSPQYGAIALALLHRSAADPGAQIEIRADDQPLIASIQPLPFQPSDRA